MARKTVKSVMILFISPRGEINGEITDSRRAGKTEWAHALAGGLSVRGAEGSDASHLCLERWFAVSTNCEYI